MAAELDRAARRHGGRLAEEARRATGARAVGESPTLIALEALWRQGFEPHPTADGTIELRSCPFDAAARENPDLVCPLALSLVDELLRELGVDGVSTYLMPRPDACCVVLSSRPVQA